MTKQSIPRLISTEGLRLFFEQFNKIIGRPVFSKSNPIQAALLVDAINLWEQTRDEYLTENDRAMIDRASIFLSKNLPAFNSSRK